MHGGMTVICCLIAFFFCVTCLCCSFHRNLFTEEGLKKAQSATQGGAFFLFDFSVILAVAEKSSFPALFGADGTPNLEGLTASQAEDLFKDAPKTSLPESEVIGHPLLNLLVKCEASKSKGDGKRMIAAGALSVNNTKVCVPSPSFSSNHLLSSPLIIPTSFFLPP